MLNANTRQLHYICSSSIMDALVKYLDPQTCWIRWPNHNKKKRPTSKYNWKDVISAYSYHTPYSHKYEMVCLKVAEPGWIMSPLNEKWQFSRSKKCQMPIDCWSKCEIDAAIQQVYTSIFFYKSIIFWQRKCYSWWCHIYLALL